MIVVTGAKGFIGSCLVSKLNKEGFTDLLLVDDFCTIDESNKNLNNKRYKEKLDLQDFLFWFDKNKKFVDFVFHIGANSDTTESRKEVFDKFNLNYSKSIWNICTEENIPLVYASSAATYGSGDNGYNDDTLPEELKPLNLYGESKNDFDKFVLLQSKKPRFWAGLKFFNVYGPNEYHKGRMASMVFHSFNQISDKGTVKLFRSHNKNFKDGGQMRDFVYVKDVVNVCFFFLTNQHSSGIYNVGTGKARSFYELASAVFNTLKKKINIELIDTPVDIRNNYQYFTEAKIRKIQEIGFKERMFSLEEGVSDYIYYLKNKKFY